MMSAYTHASYLSELDGEGAEVGDDGSTQQDIAGDVEILLAQQPRVVRPPVLRITPTVTARM